MACQTHECKCCKHMWFDNDIGEPCPKCGSPDVYDSFDE